MRLYKLGAHTKTDLKVHLIWIPKYRKKVLTGPVAIRTRDLLRQIAMEHEIEIITGIKGSNLRLTLELSCLEIKGSLVCPLGGPPAYI